MTKLLQTVVLIFQRMFTILLVKQLFPNLCTCPPPESPDPTTDPYDWNGVVVGIS